MRVLIKLVNSNDVGNPARTARARMQSDCSTDPCNGVYDPGERLHDFLGEHYADYDGRQPYGPSTYNPITGGFG